MCTQTVKKYKANKTLLFVLCILSFITQMQASTALPMITYAPPTYPNNTITNMNWIFINTTTNENLSQSFLEWGNSSGFINISMSNASASMKNWYINMTDLSDSTYNYTVWAENTTSAWNRSTRRQITTDTIPPYEISSCQELLIENGAYILTQNITSPGACLTITANKTMSNTSASAWYLNISVPGSGSNNIKFYCNDTAGNMGESSIQYFTISIMPRYFNTTAVPGVGIIGNNSNFSVDWTDLSGLSTCIFSHTFDPTVLNVQQQNISNRQAGFGSTRYRAQSFIPESSGYIVDASIYLEYQSGSKGDMFYEIRTSNIDAPASTILGNARLPSNAITTAGWYSANFTAPVSVSSGVTYWIVAASPSSSSSNVYRTYYTSTDRYSSGYMIQL